MTFWIPRQSAEDPHRFSLEATSAACVGPPDQQFFMGGVAMAATVEAMERVTGKPLLWASMQFLSHGMLGDDIIIDLETMGGGRNIAQMGAKVRSGDRLLQQAIASLGGRDGYPKAQFTKAPDVPMPQDCPERGADAYGKPGNLLDQFEKRVALQDDETGAEYLWMRLRGGSEMSAGLLALLADFFLGAHSRTRGGVSLDNNFRLVRRVPTQWVLNVTQLSAFGSGAVHGVIHQYSEDGHLMAVAGQTGLLPRR